MIGTNGMGRCGGWKIGALVLLGWPAGAIAGPQDLPGFDVLGVPVPSMQDLAEGRDGALPLYAQATQAIEDRRQCAAALPAERAAIEARFAAMTRSNQRYLSTRQWQRLEAALPARPAAPSGGGWALHCASAQAGWATFDARIEQGRAARVEQVALDEMSRSGRDADASRGAIGIELAPGMAAQVRGVLADSPAARAGLRTDDEILALDGRRVATADGVLAAIARAREGQVLRLRVRRIQPDRTPPVRDWDVEVVATTAAALGRR